MRMKTMTDTTIATNIIQQMGGFGKISMLTGAKNFVAGVNYVAFTIGKGAKNKINKVKVTLNSQDLYDVEFGREWGMKYTKISGSENIFNDMLMDEFETATGFFLTLKPRG
jgi:hypothetical protein